MKKIRGKIKRKNKKKVLTITLIFLLVIIMFVCLFQVFNLKRYIIPIYRVEDRTENIKNTKKKYDEDVVGWLKVQGTNIDYPVIHMNSYIEDSTYDYVWMNDTISKLTNHITILGHNIRNVSSTPIIGDSHMNRFEQLMGFIYSDFNQDNKYIQFTVGGKNYLYQIFSVSFIAGGSIEYDKTTFTKSEQAEYIKRSLEDSFFDYDVEVTSNDKIISLVTCTRFDSVLSNKFKVDAKLVNGATLGYNYGVTERETYREVKKILEGDGNNA